MTTRAAGDDTTRRASANATTGIREAILQGEFVPGQRLVEIDLSEHFQASRGAVRSALLELASEGLVERMANRGARVRIVPLEEAIEIYEVRMCVESLCTAKAANRISKSEARELRQIGKDMKTAVNAGDISRYGQLNRTLHARVRELSGQQTATAVLERLRGQSVRQQFKLAATPGRPQVSLPEHLAIINAICSGDEAGAEQAVRVHLKSVMEAMRAGAIA